jgi:hypothetical protein
MHMNLRNTLALAMLGLGITLQVHADTIYVDQRFGPGGTGTSNAPYNTIQAAINNANSTTIIVYPGTYSESLNIPKSLTVLGYDGPLTTRVNAAGGGNAVTLAQNITVTIQGLTLSSGVYGVYQPTAGTLYLQNCIICGNTSHGIYLACSSSAVQSTVYIDNCISCGNGGSGIYIQVHNASSRSYSANVRIYNSILCGNQRYGLESNVNGFDTYGLQDTISIDYNDYVANVLGNYSALFGPGMDVPAGSHSFSVAPDFVGGAAYSCNQDYRLLPTSACKNVGQIGLGWLNPDGTRNDIGAYGGPGAATFYTNPNDGPIIRNVTIDQGMVPRGSTFTIRATGAVR